MSDKECVYREDAVKILRGDCVARFPTTFANGLFAAADALEHIPAAPVREVVTSRWDHYPEKIPLPDGGYSFGDYYPVCHNCKKRPKHDDETDFCPNCGADMRGEEEKA